MKKVFTARHGAEASFMRDLLESQGLTVVVRGEDLWGATGEVPFVEAWPTIWVLDDAREAEARAIVEQHEAGKGGAAEGQATWRCAKCGQELEPQFTTCWSCGTERPA